MLLWLVGILSTLAWGLSLLWPHAAQASSPAPRPGVILLMGDSLSASYGMPYEEGWVPRLQQLLDTQKLPWSIINASISGETTGGALARLPRLLEEHRPNVVWIELGGNDGLRGYPPDRIRANIEAMIEQSQAAKADVWITQIHIPPNYGPRYTERFEALYREIAEDRELRLLPFILENVALQPELMMADGIHPTAEAQPGIAARYLEILRSLKP